MTGADEKRMRLRYEGTCRVCGAFLPAGTGAIYERASRTVRCADCIPVVDASPAVETQAVALGDTGAAGASARREHQRRRIRDEERRRAKWGPLAGVAGALSGERPSTKAWQLGAAGEEAVGTRLDRLRSDGIAVLHDRRIPRSRANIDHLVLTRGGVWVIDTKRYKDQRPELRIEGGLLQPRVEKLLVGRRDRTRLVDGVRRQVHLVQEVVGSVEVVGVLCFVDGDWPLFGGTFTIHGIHVVRPKRLTKMLEDSAGTIDVAATTQVLARRFPPA